METMKVVGLLMSVSLILFSVALNLLSNSVNSIDISDMESIASMIKSVCGAFVVVGLFSVLIIPGAAALAAMGVGLILFTTLSAGKCAPRSTASSFWKTITGEISSASPKSNGSKGNSG